MLSAFVIFRIIIIVLFLIIILLGYFQRRAFAKRGPVITDRTGRLLEHIQKCIELYDREGGFDSYLDTIPNLSFEDRAAVEEGVREALEERERAKRKEEPPSIIH